MNFRILQLAGLLLLFASCSRNLTYFTEPDEPATREEHVEAVTNVSAPRIQPDDILSIKVSSLSPESNTLFNQGVIAPGPGGMSGGGVSSQSTDGYLVDSAGYIRFPVLGKLHLAGLTKEEAVQKLETSLQEYLREPVVNIRFLNYRVTVIGEVRNPSTFTVESEKLNLLTALGMAGDLTIYGKRENVLLIREEGGVRTMTRINLNSRNLLNSPYFYLQQNDVIYVEAVKARGYAANPVRANIPFVLSLVSAVTVLFWRFSR
ncbi:polysaccharide biosynthesis/export family protein [Cesiribacter sp. SM1]|uniref:polysaccharide biosynthesis/export family protein n=1 Tax=Cesiribacter sp. SM1 TaxID=2861196 RepID=UPI001CD4FBC7|nr:polysaccharide biosynthesis/export family protein [Cesiribacter sp. SM1]